ncbi:psbP domain-containing protein 3, chloroplastic isoform X2 [Ricinus communis]|uniref:psbP domain-containing protein 3, chloroplastic isoform X2 n=1 Tax=Ricinus communis TaxID=3988 RepID=UPI000772A1AB|nr:psbP domain-containing protein 3, chloroplastic isoform X2 [Ricinus communis]|eukprot:XP_015573936.1 psbP domain-containing protein 3, chloroplastic isoform X2 [Ricinus communis]
MASISLLCCNCYFTSFSNKTPLHLLKPNLNFLSASPSFRFNSCRKQHLPCCTNSFPDEDQHQPLLLQEPYGRREALFSVAFTTGFTFPGLISNAFAEIDDFRLYTDDANKFQISIPQDWRVGAGEPNGFKSVTAFYPEEASGSSVSVVITGLGPDFTRMESFGKVEAFAETLVSGLDRSWQRPPGVAAKLIDCKATKGIYYIEYTLQNPGEGRKHLFSALGMAFNGWYNRLYTVTGQFVEEESENYGSKVQKVVSSFKFI